MPDEMGTFRVTVEIENPARPGERRALESVLVDTGAAVVVSRSAARVAWNRARQPTAFSPGGRDRVNPLDRRCDRTPGWNPNLGRGGVRRVRGPRLAGGTFAGRPQPADRSGQQTADRRGPGVCGGNTRGV